MVAGGAMPAVVVGPAAPDEVGAAAVVDVGAADEPVVVGAVPAAVVVVGAGAAPPGVNVAAVTMLLFMVRVIGLFMLVRPWQLRLPKLAWARMARNVNRLLAMAASTDAALANIAWSLKTRWMPAALVNRLVQ